MRRWLLPTLLLVGLVGTWQVAASTGALADLLNLPSILVPSPLEVVEALAQGRQLYAENAWVTLREMLLGLAIALAVGLAIGYAMHLSRVTRDTFSPLIVASQAIPILVVGPIFVVWFGFGIWPKVAIIALACFFPIALGVLAGLGSVDPEATKMMRTLDASRRQILWRVESPAALPSFFTGAKIAFVFAPIAAVFGEWAGATRGLGRAILYDNAQLQTSSLFGDVVLLAVMALVLYGLIVLIERRVVTWR
jgi:ABC-type nitrate/sulfonate/bicarbonate transport system permease component